MKQNDERTKKAEAAAAEAQEGAELTDEALETVAGGLNYQYDQFQMTPPKAGD